MLRIFLDAPAYLTTLHADPLSRGSKGISTRRSLITPLVAISHSQAERVKKAGLQVVAVVYHGIDAESYPFCRDKEDYFVYVGRIDKTKGVHVAVEAARRAGRRLVIAGSVADKAYFEEHIKPYLGADITYLGEVPENGKRGVALQSEGINLPGAVRGVFRLDIG